MRHLTLVAALVAPVLAATGIAAASSATADPAAPTTTEPTTASTSAAPASTSAAPASTETSAAPTSTSAAPASTETSAAPTGARQVTYTVTTTSDLTANIYYVTADPPSKAEANDPKFMPLARTLVGPGSPWTFQATLDDPTEWAFVSASGGLRVNPEFRCEIAVDGEVVVSQQGGSGVQCSLRPW